MITGDKRVERAAKPSVQVSLSLSLSLNKSGTKKHSLACKNKVKDLNQSSISLSKLLLVWFIFLFQFFFFLTQSLILVHDLSSMSESKKDLYHHDPFYYNQHEINQSSSSFPFFNDNPSVYTHPQNLQGFDPSYMTFTDCLHGSMDYNTLSKAFDMSCTSPSGHHRHQISQIDTNLKKPSVGESAGTSENPSTPNSTVSSSSNEAGGEEESVKSKKEKQTQGCEDGDDEKSKKG